ncbi:dihydropteroate synthase [Candidatus Gracilibacteria bacterium]|nr:dihydropteroate synthase [Candidatus Gracilibacteria bacterium]NUJ99174.1 dihydropteroate synthase [Candidatus Gracilibacteria bacterium]
MQIQSKIVGVLNLSPDSFSDGKKYTPKELRERITYLSNSGADIIDVGAESTAPGSSPVSLKEEYQRLEIFFEVIGDFPHIFFSLDTMKAEVAKIGIKKGVKMINDVSGGRFDEKMFPLIAQNENISYVLMYAKKSSGRADLLPNISQEDILKVIEGYFIKRIGEAQKQGIKKEQIILDPGMGAFISPDYKDSLKVLQNISMIKNNFSLPLFIGTSRKGFLSKLTSDTGASDRLGSSLASSIFATLHGADFIRVHDIRETKQFIETWNGLQNL